MPMRIPLLLTLLVLASAAAPLAVGGPTPAGEDRFLSVLVGKGVTPAIGGLATLTIAFGEQSASKELLLRPGEPLGEFLTLRTSRSTGPFDITLRNLDGVLLRAGGAIAEQGVVFRLKQGTDRLQFAPDQEALRVSFGGLSGTLRLQAWGSSTAPLVAEVAMGEATSTAPVRFTDGTWRLDQDYSVLPGDVPFQLTITEHAKVVARVSGVWDLTLASPRLRGFEPDVGDGVPVANIGSSFAPAQRGLTGRLTGAAFEELARSEEGAGDVAGRMVLFGTGEGDPSPGDGAAAPAAGGSAQPQGQESRLVDLGLQVALPLLALAVAAVAAVRWMGKGRRRR
jgi:hypothetical protein